MNKFELARDPNTSPKVLGWMATDRNYVVRYWCAKHPNCLEYIKTYFAARNFICVP